MVNHKLLCKMYIVRNPIVLVVHSYAVLSGNHPLGKEEKFLKTPSRLVALNSWLNVRVVCATFKKYQCPNLYP